MYALNKMVNASSLEGAFTTIEKSTIAQGTLTGLVSHPLGRPYAGALQEGTHPPAGVLVVQQPDLLLGALAELDLRAACRALLDRPVHIGLDLVNPGVVVGRPDRLEPEPHLLAPLVRPAHAEQEERVAPVGEQLLGRPLLLGREQRLPPALVGLGRIAGPAERVRERPVLRAGDVVESLPQQERLHGQQLGPRVDGVPPRRRTRARWSGDGRRAADR